MMKTIIAGSRNISAMEAGKLIRRAVEESGFHISEVVSGGAYGVDAAGEVYAVQNDIPIKRFLPDYQAYGRRAPILRNAAMADYAAALIAIWDGRSRGTRHMIDCAALCNLQIYLLRYDARTATFVRALA